MTNKRLVGKYTQNAARFFRPLNQWCFKIPTILVTLEVSGQIIIFRQSRFPWNCRGFPVPKTAFWGKSVVWGRYNLTRSIRQFYYKVGWLNTYKWSCIAQKRYRVITPFITGSGAHLGTMNFLWVRCVCFSWSPLFRALVKYESEDFSHSFTCLKAKELKKVWPIKMKITS